MLISVKLRYLLASLLIVSKDSSGFYNNRNSKVIQSEGGRSCESICFRRWFKQLCFSMIVVLLDKMLDHCVNKGFKAKSLFPPSNKKMSILKFWSATRRGVRFLGQKMVFHKSTPLNHKARNIWRQTLDRGLRNQVKPPTVFSNWKASPICTLLTQTKNRAVKLNISNKQ